MGGGHIALAGVLHGHLLHLELHRSFIRSINQVVALQDACAWPKYSKPEASPVKMRPLQDIHHFLQNTARRGHEAVVKLLLEKGAEPETKDKIDGWTPLSYAAGDGHEAVVKLAAGEGRQETTIIHKYEIFTLYHTVEKPVSISTVSPEC
jgi:hypothetical protein